MTDGGGDYKTMQFVLMQLS